MIQDIYGVLSDDQKGVRGSTSSNMGKVQKVTLWVNTNKHGQSSLSFIYDKDRDIVLVQGNIPKNWVTNIENVSAAEKLQAEQSNAAGMRRLGSLI
jgi:hypothetical protein